MKRRARLVVVVAAMLARAHDAAGSDSADPFRFERAVLAPAGWARAELPADVLDACRPALPDLRVLAPDGSDVPYALESSAGAALDEVPLRDVETLPGRETTAEIDRGAHPALADGASIVVDGDDFLKPVVVEASDDRASWREMARGSIFATSRARMTALRFAPNDRRWWRLRIDDRLGAPVVPHAVLVHAAGSPPASRARVLRVERAPRAARTTGTSVYALTLPSANLSVSRLHLAVSDAAFVRHVEVLERVFFRGEVSRRAVGGGTVLRAPGGSESLDVVIGELAGRSLEIAIDDGASPPLALAEVTVDLDARAVVFLAPAASRPLRLAYGSASAAAPRYDLGAALALGKPRRIEAATFGPPVDHGAPVVAASPRGAPIDPAAWRERRPIALPEGDSGGVAYLALDTVDLTAPGELRVVDAEGKQVPFVREGAETRARSDARTSTAERGAVTVVTLHDLEPRSNLVAVLLEASAPAYFTRTVTVVEATRDARGVTGSRRLGGATWERKPGAPDASLAVAIDAPSQPEIEVRIENGDNAPIALGPVAVERSVRRIDFEYAAGDRMELWTGNAAATAPSYDLALLADALFASPAAPATLGAPRAAPSPDARATPPWFWAAVVAAGLIVAAVLVRSLTRPEA